MSTPAPIPPAGYSLVQIAAYLQGFADGAASATPLPATADLVAALSAATAGQLIVLTPGATYTLNGTPTIKAANVRVNLNGATVAFFPAPGASSDIAVESAAVNFEFFGGAISRGVTCFRTYADGTYLHDLTVAGVNAATGTGCTTFALADIGGTNLKLHNVSCGLTNGVTVYMTADGATIDDTCSFAGSIGEDCLRTDCDSNGKIPQNISIAATGTNDKNAYGKEYISIRQGKNVTIGAITTDWYIRLGETGAAAPGSVVTATVSGATFTGLVTHTPNHGGLQQIAIKSGCIVEVDAGRFTVDATQEAVGLDPQSTLTLKNNTRVRSAAGLTVLPTLCTLSPGATPPTETGSTVIDPPAPAKAA